MAFLNTVTGFFGALVSPSITAPGKMWHQFILWVFDWIGDYGWSIVLFTVLLKLVLSPLDFYQRYKMHKNQKITERLKPTMEKIQKQYGGDKQAFTQKQMELNRKEGYSYFSSCLPMIVTMVVFITLWLSMNTVAQYMTLKDYTRLYDAYTVSSVQVEDQLKKKSGSEELTEQELKTAISFGQDVAYKIYYDGLDDKYIEDLCKEYGLEKIDMSGLKDRSRVQADFLWIENIWAPDVPWGDKAILDWKSFKSSIGDYAKSGTNGLKGDKKSCLNEESYKRVMGKLLSDKKHSRTNGLLILPILVVLLSVGSQLLSMYQQKRAGQVNNKGGVATSMKVMMFIMPLMMAVFAIQYASIFTLYMVTNSATSLFFNFLFTSVIKFADNRKHARNYGISTGSTRRAVVTSAKSPIIHYVKGANPDAGKKPPKAEEYNPQAESVEKPKKSKKSSASQVAYKRSGRPDPNDLMGMDMGKSDVKKKK